VKRSPHETQRLSRGFDPSAEGTIAWRKVVEVSQGLDYDAQIYTSDASKLGEALSRNISKSTALKMEAHEGHVTQRIAASQLAGSNRVQHGQAGRLHVPSQAVGTK
jgi:hypothetical protein